MSKQGVNPITGKRYAWEAEQEAKKADVVAVAELEKQIQLLERQKAIQEARRKFMPFIKFTSPDADHPNDVSKSKYQNALHHDALASALERVVDGDIQFLIITMPPRHGKSEQVSRRLPAWFMGRFPELNGIVGTYNDDFASDFGKEVRDIVKSPQYRQVFPETRLQRGGSASDRLKTTKGGQWSFVGRGGSLTGRGGHCFVSGTMVLTKDTRVQIQHLKVGDEVLSYDGKSFCAKRVQAISARSGARVFRITTATGRVVEATGDHPFYSGGAWVEAAKLTPGDPLVRAVRGDVRKAGRGCQQTPETGSGALLLLQRMLGRRYEPKVARATALRSLWGPRSSQRGERGARRRAHILLSGLLERGAQRRVRTACVNAYETLCAMQRYVLTGELKHAVLRARMRVQSACWPCGRGRKPAMERWGFSLTREAACYEAVSRDEVFGVASGRQPLRAVRVHGVLRSTSHRREPPEQQSCQPDSSMPAVSYEGSFLRAEEDTVRSVEDTGRTATVYDIQVEGTHCFFAEDLLVHNCLILDDLIKDDKEAQSQAIRDQAWNWFTKVAMTRRMGKKLVIMTFTRWHSDDPIGRLTDPENEHYNHKLAKRLKIINLPAIAEEDDPLGRKPGEPLWPDGPDKFDLDYLEEQQSLDPLGFAALYQGRPSVMDGVLFRRENVRYYRSDQLPDSLHIYCASDHAVGTNQRNDPTVLLKVGIDHQSNIYLLDCIWKKMPTDEAVEAMLVMAGGNMAPLLWWAERGHISKSIGPFLRKRMVETGQYINLIEVTPAADKTARAQPIAARFAMGKVLFPRDAPWTEKAINQLMGFPNVTHDDFVDALAYIGLGLQKQVRAPGPSTEQKAPAYGTLAWVKYHDTWKKQQNARQSRGGF